MKPEIHQNENERYAESKENTLWNINDNSTDEQISPCSIKTVDTQTNGISLVVSEETIEKILKNTELESSLLEENNNNKETNTQDKVNVLINKKKKLVNHLEKATTIILESNHVSPRKGNEIEGINSFYEANTQDTERDLITYNDKPIRESLQTLNRNSESKIDENIIQQDINTQGKKNVEKLERNISMQNIKLEMQKQKQKPNFDVKQPIQKNGNLKEEKETKEETGEETEDETEEETKEKKKEEKTQYYIMYDKEEEQELEDDTSKHVPNFSFNDNDIPNFNFNVNDIPNFNFNVNTTSTSNSTSNFTSNSTSNSNSNSNLNYNSNSDADSSSCVIGLDEFRLCDDSCNIEKLPLSKENVEFLNSIKNDKLPITNMEGQKKEVEYYKLNSTTDCSVSLCSIEKIMYESDYNAILKTYCNYSSKESSYPSVISSSNMSTANKNGVSFPQFVSTGNVIVASTNMTNIYNDHKLNSADYSVISSNNNNNKVSTTCAEFYKSCNLFPFKKRLTHSNRVHVMKLKNNSNGGIKKMLLSTGGFIDIYHHANISPVYWGANALQTSQPLHYIRRKSNAKLVKNVSYRNNNHFQIQNYTKNCTGTENSIYARTRGKVCKKKALRKNEQKLFNCNCFNYKKLYDNCINIIKQVRHIFYFCIPNKNHLNESKNYLKVFESRYMNENVYIMDDNKGTSFLPPRKVVYNNKNQNNTIEIIKRTIPNQKMSREFLNARTTNSLLNTKIRIQREIYSNEESNANSSILFNPFNIPNLHFTPTTNKCAVSNIPISELTTFPNVVERKGNKCFTLKKRIAC